MARIWVTTRTLRRSQAIYPDSGEGGEEESGNLPGETDDSSNIAECVRRYTSQLVARRVIQVPIREMDMTAEVETKIAMTQSAPHAGDSWVIFRGVW